MTPLSLYISDFLSIVTVLGLVGGAPAGHRVRAARILLAYITPLADVGLDKKRIQGR